MTSGVHPSEKKIKRKEKGGRRLAAGLGRHRPLQGVHARGWLGRTRLVRSSPFVSSFFLVSFFFFFCFPFLLELLQNSFETNQTNF
jgi:hypothetical protein